MSVKANRGWLGVRRGKSGLHRAECWITSSEGDFKESATEMCTAGYAGKGGTVR